MIYRNQRPPSSGSCVQQRYEHDKYFLHMFHQPPPLKLRDFLSLRCSVFIFSILGTVIVNEFV